MYDEVWFKSDTNILINDKCLLYDERMCVPRRRTGVLHSRLNVRK